MPKISLIGVALFLILAFCNRQLFAQTDRLSTHDYHEFRGGLPQLAAKMKEGKAICVAYLGGSITYNPGWRDSISHYFQQQYPLCQFDFINAGIPSMGSTPSAFRMGRDVLAKGLVDLLFVEAAVNDATNGRSDLEQQRAIEGIIRQARGTDPAMGIVLMHFVDPDKMKSYRNGQVPPVIQNHELVAHHYSIPSINLAKEVTDRIDAGEFSWEDDFINLHPSPFGQGVYASSMIDYLDVALSSNEGEKEVAEVPRKLIDGCYDRGQIVSIDEAQPSSGWQFVDKWSAADGERTRPGYTDVPMLVGTGPNQPIVIDFDGSAVGIAIAAGADAGIVDYRIDGGAWQRQNLFTRWSASLHLPWYYTLAAGMPDGPHRLEVKVSDLTDSRSAGKACRIRHFYVNGR